jgi:hypothetical protein
MMMALGSYTEQEAKKLDEWRDQTWGQLYGHTKHEILELGRSDSLTKQLHNAIDLCGLGGMLIIKVLERMKEYEENAA